MPRLAPDHDIFDVLTKLHDTGVIDGVVNVVVLHRAEIGSSCFQKKLLDKIVKGRPSALDAAATALPLDAEVPVDRVTRLDFAIQPGTAFATPGNAGKKILGMEPREPVVPPPRPAIFQGGDTSAPFFGLDDRVLVPYHGLTVVIMQDMIWQPEVFRRPPVLRGKINAVTADAGINDPR